MHNHSTIAARLSVVLVLATLAWVVLAGMSRAQTPKSAELIASSDNWVDETNPAAAHGADSELVARFERGKGSRILITFDLDVIEGAHVESAQLQLTVAASKGAPTVQMAASGVQGAWTESTTWSDQPERTQTYAIVEVGSQKTTTTWDITQLLRDTIEGRGSLNGIAISGPVGGSPPEYSRAFASREAGAAGPKLTVAYVPGVAVRASPSQTITTSPSPSAKEPEPPGSLAVRVGLAIVAAAIVAGVALALLRRRRESAQP